MKKVLLVLIVLFVTPLIFCEKDWDPKEHWKESLEYINEDIEDLKEWLEDEDNENIVKNINSQIELKEMMLSIINEALEMDKKDYESVEMKFKLLKSKEHILFIEVKLLEAKDREELSESDNNEIELLIDLMDIKKKILELQEVEVKIEEDLRKMHKKRKIQELKEELEALEE